MKISYNWLKSIIPFDWSVEELAEKLTMSGSEVEAYEKIGGDFENVVTAEVRSVSKHPDADKLSVCEVYNGNEIYQVVCGAPNVAEKQKVIFAKIGAELPNGLKIKKAKLRGVESKGMICSLPELNLGDDSSGIEVLSDDTEIGIPVKEIYGGEDYSIELEITPNRPDCLSHRGLGREVQALGGGILSEPDIKLKETGNDISDEVSIEIENPEDCPRYTARVIKNVKIKPSPPWLKAKLHAVGIRAINNVVDITNYVMMEYGHPLHAFDYGLFSTKKVVVRGAKKDEIFITLDGVERTLPEDSILITDGHQNVALGGIMGGLDSEVTEKTTNVLLESAYFNPKRIRFTAKSVKLSTESSQRFERGADCKNLTLALDKATQLINELAGGGVCRGIADCYPKKHETVEIKISINEINNLLGTELDIVDVSKILESLDIRIPQPLDDLTLIAEIPSFRPDLTRQADLIEEVARIYGFDNIPAREILSGPMDIKVPDSFRISDILRKFFTSCGFDEVFNWVLYDPKKYGKLDYDYNPVKISNPLSEDTAILRPHLISSLLDNIGYNFNRNIKDIGIFEIGYGFQSAGPGKIANQDLMFALAWTGNARKLGWGNPAIDVDIFDLKGLVEDFLLNHYILNFALDNAESSDHINPFFDKKSSQIITIDNQKMGCYGRLSSKATEAFDLKVPVWIMTISLSDLIPFMDMQGKFKEPPKYPPSDRDLAVVVDKSIVVGELLSFVKSLKIKYLENIQLFDIYTGKQIPEGKQSLALTLRFRHNDRTLTDQEIEQSSQLLLSKLKGKYNLDLRK
ncbi:MAG: phenylalanine--tRNA ligase subunit beta [candidate division Zixibacteria bacterium]|nr:phenylalanine--tRNA ligase subunit beta [candidate division Zixibacteria bacterium]